MQKNNDKTTKVKKNPQPTVDIAAELLANLFIEQAKWKKANKIQIQIKDKQTKPGQDL